MMFSPGDSVRVYLPNRSMVQSKPCGTVLTPANSVTMTSSTNAMAKMSKPLINPPRREPGRSRDVSPPPVMQRLPFPFVCPPAAPVQPAVVIPIAKGEFAGHQMQLRLNTGQVPRFVHEAAYFT